MNNATIYAQTQISIIDKRIADYFFNSTTCPDAEQMYYFYKSLKDAHNQHADAIIDYMFDYRGGVIRPDRWGDIDNDYNCRKRVKEDTRERLKTKLAYGFRVLLGRTASPKYVADFNSVNERDYLSANGNILLQNECGLFPLGVWITFEEDVADVLLEGFMLGLSKCLQTECVYIIDSTSKSIPIHTFSKQYNEPLGLPQNMIDVCYYAKELMNSVLSSNRIGYRTRLQSFFSDTYCNRDLVPKHKDAIMTYEVFLRTREYYNYPVQLGLMLEPYSNEVGTIRVSEIDYSDIPRIDFTCRKEQFFYHEIIVCKKEEDPVLYAVDRRLNFKMMKERRPDMDHERYGKAWVFKHPEIRTIWHILYVSDFS